MVSNLFCGFVVCVVFLRFEFCDGLLLNIDISEDCSIDVIGFIESSIDSVEIIVGCV